MAPAPLRRQLKRPSYQEVLHRSSKAYARRNCGKPHDAIGRNPYALHLNFAVQACAVIEAALLAFTKLRPVIHLLLHASAPLPWLRPGAALSV